MRRSILLLSTLLLAAPAQAKDVTIGKTSIALTLPAGFCDMDPSQASDDRIMKAVESMLAGANRLLAMSAECKQLTQWREGKRPLLSDFSQVQTSTRMMEAESPPNPQAALKEICATLRTDGEKAVVGLASDMKSRIEAALKEVKQNQVRFLGVVAEDPTACYAVIVQRMKAETGKDVTLMALSATAYVKGKIVFYYLYAPYQNNYTVTALLARHKTNVAALLAANKN